MMSEHHKRLMKLCHYLGWPTVIEHRHVVARTVPNLRKGQVIRFWYYGDYDTLALHINENPPWYACVYALKYRICTGWHKFYPYKNEDRLRREASRLSEFLSYSFFCTPVQRREFRRRHPECAGYSWRKLREDGPPYGYEGGTPKKGITKGGRRTS